MDDIRVLLRLGSIILVRREYFCIVEKYSRFDPKTVQSVTFLGQVISAQGVASFEKLRFVLEVLNFIGRSLPDLADVTAPSSRPLT